VVTATATTGPSSGQRIGPAPLRQLHDAAGTLAYGGTLAPGEWAVVVDMGTPALGHCAATVRVAAAGASPVPAEVRCGVVASSGPAAAPGGSSGSGAGWWLAVGVAILTAIGAVFLFAKRKRPLPVPSRSRRR
jgi:hypothetical protein